MCPSPPPELASPSPPSLWYLRRRGLVLVREQLVRVMVQLRMAYEANDLPKFERTLKNKQNKILDDPFIMTYVEPLRRRMREQVSNIKSHTHAPPPQRSAWKEVEGTQSA